MERICRRRKIVAGLCSVAAVGIAGCTGGESDDEESTTLEQTPANSQAADNEDKDSRETFVEFHLDNHTEKDIEVKIAVLDGGNPLWDTVVSVEANGEKSVTPEVPEPDEYGLRVETDNQTVTTDWTAWGGDRDLNADVVIEIGDDRISTYQKGADVDFSINNETDRDVKLELSVSDEETTIWEGSVELASEEGKSMDPEIREPGEYELIVLYDNDEYSFSLTVPANPDVDGDLIITVENERVLISQEA